jgi:hypothetical protein
MLPGLAGLLPQRRVQKGASHRVSKEGVLEQLGGCPTVPLILPQTASQKILQTGGQGAPAADCSQHWQLVLHTATRHEGDKDQTQAENVGFFAAAADGGRVGVLQPHGVGRSDQFAHPPAQAEVGNAHGTVGF